MNYRQSFIGLVIRAFNTTRFIICCVVVWDVTFYDKMAMPCFFTSQADRVSEYALLDTHGIRHTRIQHYLL